MFNFRIGKPIAKVVGGQFDGEIIHICEKDDIPQPCCSKCSSKCRYRPCCRKCNGCGNTKDIMIGDAFELEDGIMEPLLSLDTRPVDYIAGPSGSGKSYTAAKKIRNYRKIFPEKEFFIFSRTDSKNDPALKDLGGTQITIDKTLVDNPINIEEELSGGCLILFDDCNTIQDDKFKKAIEKLMNDIMEVGRKLDIAVIITNHLVIPNEKKFARTMLNEMQTLTVFPKSGSSQQIKYALKNYFGLSTKQIDEIMAIPSRWLQITKSYPMFVLHERGAFTVS